MIETQSVAADALPECRIACSELNRLRQAVKVPRLEQQSVFVVTNNLPRGGNVGGDEDPAAGLRFEIYQ